MYIYVRCVRQSGYLPCEEVVVLEYLDELILFLFYFFFIQINISAVNDIGKVSL